MVTPLREENERAVAPLFDPRPANYAERHLLDALAGDDIVDFEGVSDLDGCTIRAGLLRYLLLVPGRVPLFGLHLRRARIKDKLDLRDFAMPGSGLPAVSLEDCDFTHELDLSSVRMARLSLAGSRFSKLCLRDAEIDGPLDISRVCPWRELGVPLTCWIDARDCTINGEINASGAKLQGASPPVKKPFSSEIRYALWLRNAVIQGNVNLTDGFTARGGVSLGTAHVGGNVWARGAVLTACEDDAFNAQNARIDGGLMLDAAPGNRFCANGTVWLLGIHIGNTLQLDGAILNGVYRGERPDWNEPRDALAASNIEVGTSVFMKGARVRGPVSFSGARVHGRLDCRNAIVTDPPSDRAAFFAPGIEVAHNAEFEQSVVHGGIDFTGATISGNLRFRRVTLSNDRGGDRDATLTAERARIGGSVDFLDDTRSKGELNFSGTVVGKNLTCENSAFSNPVRSAIYARDLEVGCDLRLIDTKTLGDLNLEHANIKGRLLWRRVRVGLDSGVRRRWATINLQHARIGAALEAEQLCFVGPVRIDLRDSTLSALKHHWPEGWGVLDGDPAKKLGCEDHPVKLDGLTYERIVLKNPKFPDNTDKNEAALGDAMVEWLKRQDCELPGGKRAEFFPQPHRQLARVLRAQGNEGAARRVAVAEQDEPRRRSGAEQGWIVDAVLELVRPAKDFLANWVRRKLHRLYGIFFGYGLKPARAFVTLVAYVAIGMFGVRFLHDSGMLIERPIPVAAFAAHDEPGGSVVDRLIPVAAFAAHDEPGSRTSKDSRPGDPELGFRVVPIDEGGMISDLRCTDAANSTWDSMVYAIDMILPFIQLHEENKCEIRADAGMRSWFWRVLRDVYVLIGWVVSSAALLTMSGILRKSDESGSA